MSPRPPVADAGRTPYDPITLRFDRMEDGTLIAVYSGAGRGVAAIVHPAVESLSVVPVHRWNLAGQLSDRANRPRGEHRNRATACAEAARALGVELGLDVAGWSVESIDEARLRHRAEARLRHGEPVQ